MNTNQMRDEFYARIDASEIRGHNFDDRDVEIYLNTAIGDEVIDMFMPDKNQRGVGYSSDKLRRLQLTGLVTKAKSYKIADGDFMLGTEDNGALAKPHEDGLSIEYGVFVRVPNECLFPILMRCDITDGDCLRRNITTILIDELYYEQYLNNGQRKPYKSLVWCMEFGNYTFNEETEQSEKGMSGITTATDVSRFPNLEMKIDSKYYRVHHLIAGKDFEITAYHLRYVKRPNLVVIDIENPAKQVNCELDPAIHKNIVERAVKLAIAAIIPKESKYNVAQEESSNNA